jgi:hypothetical protein
MENSNDWGTGYYGNDISGKPITHAYFITRLLMYGKLEENDFRGNLPRGRMKGTSARGANEPTEVGVDNMRPPNHQ